LNGQASCLDLALDHLGLDVDRLDAARQRLARRSEPVRHQLGAHLGVACLGSWRTDCYPDAQPLGLAKADPYPVMLQKDCCPDVVRALVPPGDQRRLDGERLLVEQILDGLAEHLVEVRRE
jgi:hypothetical protein